MCCSLILCGNDSSDLSVSSPSSMEVDKNDVLTEVDGIESKSIVERRNDSPCAVDNESNSLHAKTTDDLSDDVTLAVADSTTSEMHIHFKEVYQKENGCYCVCL